MRNSISLKLIGLFLVLTVVLAGCGGQGESTGSQGVSVSPAEQGTNSGGVQSGREDWPSKIRFAVTDVEGMEELQRSFGPFKDVLEELMSIKVEMFAVTDRIIGATALEYDQVDMLLAGPSEYAQIRSVIPDAEPIVAIERDNYYSVVMIHEDSEFKELEDLKGKKKVAMSDAGSTSGHIGPSIIFIEEGFNLDQDIEIMLLGDARIEAFKNREVDALATRMTDYLQMVEEDGEGKYRLLIEGPPLPSDPFVVSPKLPKDFVEELQSIMLENQEQIIESIVSTGGENDKFKQAKLKKGQDSDYNSMREAYRVLGIELE